MEQKSLGQLMLAAQKGDGQAYESFLNQASELLTPFIKKRIDREDFFDDVLQDTLIAIHKSKHTYLIDRSLEAWIYVICDHRITDFYRKFRRVEKAEVIVPDEKFHLITKEPAPNDLTEVLENLPEKQKMVIMLMKIDGLSIKEVATKMQMSESSVKVTAFRGYETLKRLREFL